MSLIKPAFAQEICNPVLPWTCGNPSSENLLGKIISSSIGMMLALAGILAFFFLITGGIQWITSSGDKANLEAARNRIMHAILGLVLVTASWAIMTLVFQWLGIPFPNISFPSIGQDQPASPPFANCVINDLCQDPNNRSTACPASQICRREGAFWYCCPR